MSENTYYKKCCLLCETNDYTKVKFEQNFKEEELNAAIFSARRNVNHYHYRFLECAKCSSVFSSPVLPQEIISVLYKESKQNYDLYLNHIVSSYGSFFNRHSSALRNKMRALELGCGSGFFMSFLEQAGFEEVYGIEPSVEAVEKSGRQKDKIFNGIFEEWNYPLYSFDYVCSFQTIDHLLEPLAALVKIHTLLKADGLLQLVVHDEKAWQAKLFGERSPIYDVEHIYLFNKKTLRNLCEKAGFEVLTVESIKNSYPLEYWINMAPIPAKKICLMLLRFFKCASIPISLRAGNIGLVARKRK